MLRLIGLVVSIGLADSLNPTTIGPAPYLAVGERGRRRVAEFTLAVFTVYLLGGIAIALGPGQLVLSVFPHPRRGAAHILEIVAGAAMLGVAGFLWSRRRRLSQRGAPATNPEGRSSVILGAAITAVELPTAFPYFAAIAAIVGSGIGTTRQIALLVLFDVCFVLPLIGIVGMLTVAGDGAAPMISRARDRLRAHWPAVLAGVALLAGIFVVTIGVTGLTSHTPFGRFVRNRLFLRHLG
jgi:cytochrome c biogenesis protein CcdA